MEESAPVTNGMDEMVEPRGQPKVMPGVRLVRMSRVLPAAFPIPKRPRIEPLIPLRGPPNPNMFEASMMVRPRPGVSQMRIPMRGGMVMRPRPMLVRRLRPEGNMRAGFPVRFHPQHVQEPRPPVSSNPHGPVRWAPHMGPGQPGPFPGPLLPDPLNLNNLDPMMGDGNDGLLPIPNAKVWNDGVPVAHIPENDSPRPPLIPNEGVRMTVLPAPPPLARPVRPLVNQFPDHPISKKPDVPLFEQTPVVPLVDNSMEKHIELISRFLVNREYNRLYQFIRDNIQEGQPISPSANQAVIFAVREMTVQLAFGECFQMFRFISHPSLAMLEALTDMVSEHADRLRNNEVDIWLPFNKAITWHISTRTPIPPSLIDTMVKCFSSLDSWPRVWSALQLCHQSNCLPPTSVSKVTLERLLNAMLYDQADGSDGVANKDEGGALKSGAATGISLGLAIHLLEPYLPPAPGSINQMNPPPSTEPMRCDILVRVWLRCVDENEAEWAHRIGGPGGNLLVGAPQIPMLLNVPPPNIPLPPQQVQDRETVLSILRNRIAELIVSSNYNGVVQIMVFGYNFLPELADAFVTNLLMVTDTQKAFTSLMKLAQCKTQGIMSSSALSIEVNRCLAYVCLQLAHSYCERRQWLLVVQLHESVITSQQGSELLMATLPSLSPTYGIQYPLTIIEAALKLKKFSLTRAIMQTFTVFSQPFEDPGFRNKRYVILRDLIEAAIIENDLESAVDIFWILQRIFDEDIILECPTDVNEIFNDLIVRNCKAGGVNMHRGLELGRRGMAFTKTRLVVLAFPLRVLMTEAVRQGCCSVGDANAKGPEVQNKQCVFDLAERGFQVAIYPRPEVRMSDLATTQNLYIPTDATTEEIHVLLTIYCRILRQQLLNLVRENTSSDVLNLCELTIWPQNVGVRDVQLTQLYQLDVSSHGVLKRVEQVLSSPLFLSGAIDFERQTGPMPGLAVVESKLVVQKFKLYHVVYYSKLD